MSRAVGRVHARRTAGLTPFFFVAPFLLIFAVFLAYPLALSLALAFQQTSGPGYARFVGLGNLEFLLRDELFWKAFGNTAIFAASSLAVQVPLSLGLAMLLSGRMVRGRAIWRLVLFSPSLVGLVFVAMMFSLIFEKNTGLLNTFLHSISGGRFSLEYPWLEVHVMPALIISSAWMYTGFNMIYFLAALQNVRRELVEAASIDGAGPWMRFVNVTLPAIRPVGGFVVLLSVIGSFQLFELPWILLNGSPGQDNRGLTLVMYLYQTGFEQGDLGYASAIGWAIAVLLVTLALLQRKLVKQGDA